MTQQILKIGDCREVLKELNEESIDCVVTSPPYWGLRDYGTEPLIWDGSQDCEHEWETECKKWHSDRGDGPRKEVFDDSFQHTGTEHSFCLKCGAWKGQLGLEPTPELYIKHLCDIFDQVKRILKKTGTSWVNLGDTFAGSWGNYGSREGGQRTQNVDKFDRKGVTGPSVKVPQTNCDIPQKSLVQIPSRFSIEMVNRGWILRNEIIWHKPNCMPDSTKDRFTVDFEKIFFFVKSNEPQYWTNEQIGETTKKKPLGTSGIEGIDWVWDGCPKCFGHGYTIEDNGYFSDEEPQKITCDRCKGTGGNIKRSLWISHDYWFEQQFEPLEAPIIYRRTLKLTDGVGTGKGNSAQSNHYAYGSPNPEGRNKRTVWTIPTQPYPEAHFAVFPTTLIETPIKAGCPKNGWVLDPFAGSGTVLEFCRKNGYNALGIELNPDYEKMVRERALMNVPEIETYSQIAYANGVDGIR